MSCMHARCPSSSILARNIMNDRQLERGMEWESASKPLVLQYASFPVPPFVPGVLKVQVARDENLHLEITAEGSCNDTAELGRLRQMARDVVPGTFVPMREVSFEAAGGTVALRMHIEDAPSSETFSSAKHEFVQRGSVYRAHRTWSNKFVSDDNAEGMPRLEPLSAPAWMSDWYVNGATELHYARATSRRRSASFHRDRDFNRIAIRELSGGAGFANDHIVVKTPIVSFALCRVPSDQADESLHPASIEFTTPFPDAETRTAIGEIVSFVVGRRMMRVGSTIFDATGWAIEEESVNPLGANIRGLCRTSGMPPVPYDSDGLALEALRADLVPRYLSARDAFGLKDALWSYWVAKESPTSIDLPIFSAALDTLKVRWFSSTNSKSKGLHLPWSDFKVFAGDLTAQLRKRVETKGLPEEIARNFEGANRMGFQEKLKFFFQEIGLTVGQRETAAMQARGRSAHGAGADEDQTELVRFGNAYRTLFDRVFLQMLGYTGKYIDRTTDGYPERDLTEAAGGL